MIDWPTVLREQGIAFFDKGPSTSRGNIYVHCPFCGAADQGHHMGISIRVPWRGWGCWRNNQHRGKSAAKLLAAILNISRQRAESILGIEGPTLLEDDDVKGKLDAMLKPSTVPTHKEERDLQFPKEIRSLGGKRDQIQHHLVEKTMFIDYLKERGYQKKEDIYTIIHQYQLRYCLKGLFRYRLIFPVYTMYGLTTWTGRSIVPGKEPRYLTLTINSEVAGAGEPYAKASIKDCLFNERWVSNQEGKALIVAEGPFDAMRLDFVGRQFGVHATALFGKTVSDIQIEKLDWLGVGYKRKFVLLDPDAVFDRLSIWEKMKSIGFTILPAYKGNAKDPGDLSIRETKEYIQGEVLRVGR